MPRRGPLCGNPHTYYVVARTALAQPLFADPPCAHQAVDHLETVRRAFDARCHAYAVMPDALHLVIHHHDAMPADDDYLRQRWSALGSSLPRQPAHRLVQRLTSLAGFMQTLLQRISRSWNRATGGTGGIWAGRYRACLLADDAALLATIAWIDEDIGPHAVASSRGRRGIDLPVLIAPPPLRIAPGGQWFPSDESPPGLPPPAADAVQTCIDRVGADLGPSARAAYGEALAHGWALGRPESLAGPLARLGRDAGRGRSRTLRHLDDDLGLCGVWG